MQHSRVHEPAQPAVAAERIRVVVEAADSGKDPAAAEIPFLDLVVGAFDVAAEAVEILVKTLLDPVEPCVGRVVAGVDAALLEEVVLERFEDQRVEVAGRLVPVRRLACFQPRQLDRTSSFGRAR